MLVVPEPLAHDDPRSNSQYPLLKKDPAQFGVVWQRTQQSYADAAVGFKTLLKGIGGVYRIVPIPETMLSAAHAA